MSLKPERKTYNASELAEVLGIDETPRSPLPREVTEHPGWQLIWDRLLGPTPDELDAAAVERLDDAERGVA